MTAVVPSLFKGIALVIDNEIGGEGQIDEILADIRAGGGHYVSMAALPAHDYDLDHFDRVAFFIMDWNLLGEPGLPMTSELEKENVVQNIAFLKRLAKSRHAPVFIFTNNEPADVVAELETDEELSRSVKDQHILVRSKSEVVGKLYEVLEQYAANIPSVLTLKTWERAYHSAANELFIDLHNKTPYWPVMMWQTFSTDDVPQEFEMIRLINRLVESRIGPMGLDLSAFLPQLEEHARKDEGDYRQSMYRVLEGERFLRNERLTDKIFAPGDVFCFPRAGGVSSYYINIRAECDCLHGSDDTELYLLRAKEVPDAEKQINREFGNFTNEKDNEAIIYAMFGGATFSVKFKELKIMKVKNIEQGASRIGRLLPPFLTRVQQRYAAYIQRPGLPRIPAAMHVEEEAA
ncbi:MAG: hypothetical protein EON87_01170 [Brevundimonas sp.]|nr:MAG: hypothetical protein EON87_01170 [Brevundimonas sp.]